MFCVPGGLAAMCLKPEGLKMIQDLNPFKHILACLLNSKARLPSDKHITQFGASFDDLMRYHVVLVDLIVPALLSILQQFVSEAQAQTQSKATTLPESSCLNNIPQLSRV